MAANMASTSRGNEQEIIARLQRECDELQRKYAGLESAYKQAMRRLDRSESTKSEFEQQHAAELLNVAGRIREKIQSLELRQLRAGDDFEDFKQQLKYDLSRQYQSALDELIVDLERQRRAYGDLCLKHSVLKAEFETSQLSAQDQEEKWRLKFAIQIAQFDGEREALQARIDHLSIELANANVATNVDDGQTADSNMKNLQDQLVNWRQKYDRLDADFQKYQNAAKLEIDEVKRRILENEDEKQSITNKTRRLETELIEEQRKRESADERYARGHKELLELRNENETLRRRMEIQADESNAQFLEERVKLEKQRDENAQKIEDLNRQVSILNDGSFKFESQYRQSEIRLVQQEQHFKRDLQQQKDAWTNEKIAFEAKIRDLDLQRQDIDRGNREKMQEMHLTLKCLVWEKEKLAEELAGLRIGSQPKDTKSNTIGAVRIAQPDFAMLTQRLSEQEQKFADLMTEFSRYRRKHDQFRDVLELVNTQIERTTNVDDGADAQALIEDLKGKVNQLLESRDPGTSVEKEKSGRSKISKKIKGDRN